MTLWLALSACVFIRADEQAARVATYDQDGDGAYDLDRGGDDCDDTNPNANPGAAEVCDGADNDCDGATDEDGVTPFYPDSDGDGWGAPDAPVYGCQPPPGHTVEGGDCNDANASISPDALEICNGADDDCDGDIDDNVVDGTEYFYDADHDGFGDGDVRQSRCGTSDDWAAFPGDCAPNDPDVHPEAPETPNDGLDSDCDGRDGCDDLDCDGIPDLAFAPYQGGVGHVLTTSTLGRPTPVVRANGARLVAWSAADWNRDGWVDLLGVASGDECQISTRQGGWLFPGAGGRWSEVGELTFNASEAPLEGLHPTDACVGDLDLDGTIDVILANGFDDSTHAINPPPSYVYLSDGAGAFRPAFPLASHSPRQCLLAQLDDDPFPEVLLPGYWSGVTTDPATRIYWNDGALTATAQSITSLPGVTNRALVADLGGSAQIPDLVLVGKAGLVATTDNVQIYIDPEFPDMPDPTTLAVRNGSDAAAGDVDLDGRVDLLIAEPVDVAGGSLGATSAIWYQRQDGWEKQPLAAPAAQDALLVDLDEDGDLDVVLANGDAYSSDNDSRIYWNPWIATTTGEADWQVQRVPTLGAFDVIAHDLDQDGAIDLVFTSSFPECDTASGFVGATVVWGPLLNDTANDPDVEALDVVSSRRVTLIGAEPLAD